MRKFASHLQEHTYPKLLMRNPLLIRWLYVWNGLILQRNWATKKALRKHLKKLPQNASVFDFGCGEGLHLLPWAERFPHHQFTGVDRLKNHLLFGEKYVRKTGLKNVEFKQSDLVDFSSEEKADCISCIGVLQYIAKDSTVLKNIFNTLKNNGLTIIYIPINGRMISILYRYFFSKNSHYEASQNRKRIYNQKEFFEKMEKANLEIIERHITYGTLGILGHEIYSLLLMGIGNVPWWLAWIFTLALVVLFPLIMILKSIDYLTPKKEGNGMLVVARKRLV